MLQVGRCDQKADEWRVIKLNNTMNNTVNNTTNNTSMWAIVLGANNEFIACWDTGDGVQDPYKKKEHPLLKKPFPAGKLPSIMGCGWRKVIQEKNIHHHVKDHDKGHIKGHDLRAMARYVARAMPRAMERGMVKAIRRFPGQANKIPHHVKDHGKGHGHHLRAVIRALSRAMSRGMSIRRFPGQAKKTDHHGKGHHLRAARRAMAGAMARGMVKAIRSFGRHGKGLKKSRRHGKDKA